MVPLSMFGREEISERAHGIIRFSFEPINVRLAEYLGADKLTQKPRR